MTNISLSELKRRVESLEDSRKIVAEFEKSSVLHDQKFVRDNCIDDEYMRIKMINSRLKELNEIADKLDSFCHNLNSLNVSLFTKDFKTTRRLMEKVISGDYSSISLIMDDLKDFNSLVMELENSYNKILDKTTPDLEFKLNEEEKLRSHFEQLKSIHRTQKETMVSLTKLFTKTSKKILRDNNYRSFITSQVS